MHRPLLQVDAPVVETTGSARGDAVVPGSCLARPAAQHPEPDAGASAQEPVSVVALRHEVGAPLHAVLDLTRLLLDSDLDDQQRRWLEAVHKTGLDLLTVVDDAPAGTGRGGGEERPPGRADRVALASPSVPAPRSAPRTRVRGRVLVADDNAVNLLVARAELESRGLEVDTVGDGVQAVDAARSGRYDLVLMDCQMPVLDGPAATRLLREDPRTQNLPVVAVTASASPADRLACRESGMDGFLAKPWRLHELDAVLTAWLQEGHPRAVRS